MSSPTKVEVAVVGGGLTGLAAALRLADAGRSVHLIEAATRAGGCLRTWSASQPSGDWIFELGPNTVIDDGGELIDLFAAAGLSTDSGEVLAADRAAGRRYLWNGERLVALPRHPLGMVRTPGLLGFGAKLRLLAEPWIGERRADAQPAEESVAGFARRRLGKQVVETLVEPMVSGIWAGDPERLAIDHAFPRLAAMEREHGSLVKAALAARRTARRSPPDGRSAAKPVGSGGRRMLGLADGFESLAERLVERIRASGGTVETGRPCRAIRPAPGSFGLAGGLRIETDTGTISANRAILAVPPRAAAGVLSTSGAEGAGRLADVPHAPVAVVALGFERRHVAHPLNGFGFLAPRERGLRILGCLWPSSIFPGRAPEGHVALTALAGGRTDPETVDLGDDELLDLALADLARTVGITGEPVVRHVDRWRPGIPQYEVGHHRFLDAALRIETALPGLIVAGSWIGGVSLADRAKAARAAADRALGS